MLTGGMQNAFSRRLLDEFTTKGCHTIADTISRLCQLCDVTAPAARAWLHGTMPKVEHLIRIADFLDISLDELTGRIQVGSTQIVIEEKRKQLRKEGNSCTLFIPRSLVDILWGAHCDLEQVTLWRIPHDIPGLGRCGDFAMVEKIRQHAEIKDMSWCLFSVRGQHIVRRIRLSIGKAGVDTSGDTTNEYITLSGLLEEETQMVGKIIATIRAHT